jgi:hypothetical protein
MVGSGASRGARRIRAALIAFFKRICPDARHVTADADVRRLSGLNAVGWRALAADINALPALVDADLMSSASALLASHEPARGRTSIRP